MTREDGRSRRETLAAVAGIATLSGCLGRGSPGPSPPGGTPGSRAEQESLYPLATYENVDGAPVQTMPVNVRVDLRGTDVDVERVRDVFRYDYRWSPIVAALDPLWPFHDSPAQFAWDSNGREFAAPVASYRSPFPIRSFRGEIGFHVYLWPVRERGAIVGVAGQAHKDVGRITNHVGTDFDQAAGAVSAAFARAGWRIDWGAFDYGVSPERLREWGPTGDLLVRPPDV